MNNMNNIYLNADYTGWKRDIDIESVLTHSEEIKKCKKDIAYFAENYIKVLNPCTGLASLKLRPYQKKYLAAIASNNRFVCAKCRQCGISTMNCTYALWNAIFFGNMRIGIMAPKHLIGCELISKINTMFESLPEWMKPKKVKWENDTFKLSNGSVIYSCVDFLTRGKIAPNILIVDEMAFCSDANQDKVVEEFNKPVEAFMQDYEQIVCCSTPNSLDDMFWQLFRNNSSRMSINYLDMKLSESDADIESIKKWKDNMVKAIGYDRFKLEFMNIPHERTSK